MPFAVALALALALTPVVARATLALGLVDHPAGGLKIHAKPMPLAGVAAVGAALLALVILGESLPAALLVLAAVATVVGLVDDVRPLPPWVRLLGLGAAGTALVVGGSRLEFLGPLAAAGVVFLVLACTNAVNLTDGQDGLATGLGAIAALGLAALGRDAPGGLAPGLAVAGALVGFLAWNRPPARVFLGNGGSYGVGALLAAVVLPAAADDGWRGLLAAATCLGVFAFELVFTVARRAGSGGGVFEGDRGHSYDLAARRFGRTRSTLGFWIVGALLAGLAQAIPTAPAALGWAVVGALIAAGAASALRWRSAVPRAGREPLGSG